MNVSFLQELKASSKIQAADKRLNRENKFILQIYNEYHGQIVSTIPKKGSKGLNTNEV
jgi:hypothetical protein